MNGKETEGILISATVNAWIECKNQKRERERERERERRSGPRWRTRG